MNVKLNRFVHDVESLSIVYRVVSTAILLIFERRQGRMITPRFFFVFVFVFLFTVSPGLVLLGFESLDQFSGPKTVPESPRQKLMIKNQSRFLFLLYRMVRGVFSDEVLYPTLVVHFFLTFANIPLLLLFSSLT